MPGQEKMVLDYYEKNPSAAQSLKGSIYEEKILTLFKSKINLKKTNITITEAEKIISNFNKSSQDLSAHNHNHDNQSETKDNKEKKVSKTSSNIKDKTKKVSKK
jgi:trigger factor